jgi:hypothetical protein
MAVHTVLDRVHKTEVQHEIDAEVNESCSKKSDTGTLVPRINVENGIKLGFVLE